MTVGILAYGSLVEDPGEELHAYVMRRIDGVKTPFAVEFARSSRTRGGGPTLVPVSAGGATVEASVFVLQDTVDDDFARDLLYRRETGRPGEHISYRGARADWIHTIAWASLSACLYTALEQNIHPVTAARLADLALTSASGPAGADKRDGISYLAEQKRRGLVTPLMPDYEAKVLSMTGGRDLADAWAQARASVP